MFRYIGEKIGKGVGAGALISIGCAVYLSSTDKVVGAVLFAVALLAICYLGLNLYTGRVGFIAVKHDKEAFSELFLGLFGNVLGISVCGWLLSLALPNLQVAAQAAVSAKLGQKFFETLIRGAFCGILMYVAVAVFKNGKSPLGVLFAIPVFILSGFEHSIADVGYFAIAFNASIEGFLFIMTVVLGNSVGSLFISFLANLKGEKTE